jgi:hypothetical protein
LYGLRYERQIDPVDHKAFLMFPGVFPSTWSIGLVPVGILTGPDVGSVKKVLNNYR